MIHTVKGLVNKSLIKTVLAHEHLSMDLCPIRKDKVSILKDIDLLTFELGIVVKQGINLVVDMSNESMLRNPQDLLTLSNNLNIHVVAATGYYLHEYHSDILKSKSVKEIAKEFVKDITIGINNTNIKAGIIGEIATSSKQIFPSEKNVFLASAIAHKETGCPIYTHCDFGNFAIEQIEILINNGVKPDKIIIGHMDLVEDINKLISILKTGVTIGFDTIGKESYLSDKRRAVKLIELIKQGYSHQIVLSLDISRKSYLTKFGGYGYGHLINSFYPLLKEKISNQDWKHITQLNMIKILDF